MAKQAVRRKEEAYKAIMKQGNIYPKGEDKNPLEMAEIHMVLHGNDDKDRLLDMLRKVDLEYPIDVVIKRATKNRSLAQNRTQWQWFRDAGQQGDMTASEQRAYCKLHFGIPILRRDSPEYREKYDQIIRPLEYEKKLILMMEPFDFPVTSAMNVAQHSEFLDKVKEHFEGLGYQLTDPVGWQ
jgi:hypothetical protein